MMRWSRVALDAIAYDLPDLRVETTALEAELRPMYSALNLEAGQVAALTGIRARRYHALVVAAACVMAHAAPAGAPTWSDTDPAVGEPDRDVDDGLALVQAEPELTAMSSRAQARVLPADRAPPSSPAKKTA